MGRSLRLAAVAAVLVLLSATPASAQDGVQSCPHAVVFTLPAVTWSDVERGRPHALLAAIEEGSAGSLSVRTNTSRTSLASGFVTVGGGARIDGGLSTGGPAALGDDSRLLRDVSVAGLEEVERQAVEDGYGAQPGALATALDTPVAAVGNSDLGLPAPAPVGYGRWTLLSAMDASGSVDAAAVGSGLLTIDDEAPYGVSTNLEVFDRAMGAALGLDCSVVIADQGDLVRADQHAMATDQEFPDHRITDALRSADRALGAVMELLDFESDLLLIVSPTSPAWADEAHLGIAVAVGPGFEPGSTLESASTRRAGVVTLPDVAPTILDHFNVRQPPEMNGRPMFDVTTNEDLIATNVDMDEESVFIDSIKGGVSAAFVVFQVIVYALILGLLLMRERSGGVGQGLGAKLEIAGLAVVAFPVATYLAGWVQGHELGLLWFVALLIAIDTALVTVAAAAFRGSLDRLLALCSFTFVVIAIDLITGSRLQLNTVFGYSPIVAGRFAGAGNIVFAVLGVAALLTGTLVAHRYKGARWALPAVAGLFALTVVIDGAPQFGSDVGGVLALVPTFGLAWLLLSGRKPSLRVILLSIAGGAAVLGVFLALDLARPASDQTHLARLFNDVVDRGPGVFVETLQRKATANLRVFTSTIWTYFVPPALLVMVYLLRRPSGRWQRLAVNYPRLRGGLVGGLALAVLGFAVNDSGIVIPAVVLSFLVPMALLVHLAMDREQLPS